MSDEQPPQERGPEPGEKPEHHGVVETLREEIEEAVEHVPEPVRWTVGKLVGLVLLGLAGLLVLALISVIAYFAHRTELVARELTLVLNERLTHNTDIVLEMRDLKGNPFTGIRAIAPRVRYQDGSPLLDASEMRLRYSLTSLLTGGPGPVDVTVTNAVVHLDRGPHGTWRFPYWHGHATPGRGRELDLHLHLRNARVTCPEPLGPVEGLDLDAWAKTGADMQARLERAHWKHGPYDSRLEQLAASYARQGRRVRVSLDELRTPDLDVRGDGGWSTAGGPRAFHVALGRVRWRWLAKVFDNRSFDVPGSGAALVEARYDQEWSGRFRSTLDWDSLDVEGTGRFAWNGRALRVDSLAAQSAAGDLTGALDWSREGWAIGGRASDADPSNWHALRLDHWPAGHLNGRFAYAVDTRRHDRASAALTADLVPSEWSGWRVDSAHVRVDFPATAPDSFTVTGARRGGTFELLGRMDATGWSGPYSIRDFPLDEWPDGRASGLSGRLASGAGRVESRPAGLFVDGVLRGTGTRWGGATFSRWTLANVRGRLLPAPDLTADADAADGFFLGIHADSARSAFTLGDGNVRFSSLSAWAGDTTVTMVGQAAWDRATWWMTVSSAEARSRQFHWTAEPPLKIAGDADGVLLDRVVADDGEGHLEARGRWASPQGHYDFALDASGLDVGRVGLPLEWGLGGRARAHLDVQGRPGDPHWHFAGACANAAFGGHASDSVTVGLSGAAHRLQVDDASLALDGGRLRLAGAVERAVQAFPDSLSATAVVRWLQDAGAWRGHVEAAALPIDRLGALVPAADGWGGVLNGTLDLAGSPGSPQFDVQARADHFGWRDYRAERADVRAHYADGRLDAPEIHATMLDVVSTARASVPVRLALGRPVEVPDEAVTGQLEVPRGDLQLLPLLVPQIQAARGRFDLTAQLGGTARHPRLTGVGHIRDGIVRPINREEVLDHVNADVQLDQGRITLTTLTASQGRTGRVTAHGGADLEGLGLKGYRFDLQMRDFAASEQGLYAMLIDGDFVVVDGPPVYGERLPQVTGRATVKKGVVEFDFANQSEVEKRAATTMPLYWTYRIHVDATSNLRWRPPDGDIEFDADLDLQQTADSLIIYGEMHALRGTYYFLSNRFTIRNADLTFDNQQGVDPTLDITADTQLRPVLADLATTSGTGPSGGQLETITAHITGRSSEPVIDLSSNHNWDQKQILGELTVGRFSDVGSGQLSLRDPLDNYLTRQLNNQLSANLSEFFRGAITDWEIQRDKGGLVAGEGGLVVGIGSQVTERLALRYRQRLPGFERPYTTTADIDIYERDVEAEYRLNRFIYVTTEVARRTSTPTSLNRNLNDFNVNLKARWEY